MMRVVSKTILTLRGAAVALWVLAALPAIASALFSASRNNFNSPYGDLLKDSDAAFVVSTGLWAMFAIAGVVMVLPGPFAVTGTRLILPANAAGLLWAAVMADSNWLAGHGLALLAGLAAAIVVLLPAWGDAVVDASSYGDERRFLLRAPGPILITLIVPIWAFSVIGATAGPLLLAHRNWVLGAVLTGVGIPLSILAIHALYRLAQRWLVFVPGGLVIHDHLTVGQPLPLARRDITSITPAPADTAATDLTANAFGLALEVRLKTATTAAVKIGRRKSDDLSTTALLVSPSRPAVVMTTAKQRGIALQHNR